VINSNLSPISHRLATIHPLHTTDRRTSTDRRHIVHGCGASKIVRYLAAGLPGCQLWTNSLFFSVAIFHSDSLSFLVSSWLIYLIGWV